MRIGIDARFFGPKQKGLGRYSQKLIENLEKIIEDDENEYYIFLRKENFNFFNPQNKKFKKILAEYPWYGFKEQFIFPLTIKKYKIDLMHFCHFNVPIFYRKKFLVTIHDLILFHFPTIRNTTKNRIWYFFKMLMYHLVIRSAVKRAHKIIAISEFTKNDIINELEISQEKIVVIKEGFTLNSKKEQIDDFQTISKKYDIIKPFILYVGNAYPHKNLERLCEAFSVVNQRIPDLKLVIVGGGDYFFDRLKEFVVKKQFRNIIFTGLIPDSELDILYKEAELFVFPSLYEGFGLPPLEAIARNTVVASSDRTSMPEVLGDGAQYFNPEDVNSINQSIIRILESEEKKIELIRKSRSRLQFFSWNKMAEETLSVYKKVLEIRE